MAEELVPKGIPHWGTAHRQAWMAAVGFIDRIDGKHPYAVDAERVEGG